MARRAFEVSRELIASMLGLSDAARVAWAGVTERGDLRVIIEADEFPESPLGGAVPNGAVECSVVPPGARVEMKWR